MLWHWLWSQKKGRLMMGKKMKLKENPDGKGNRVSVGRDKGSMQCGWRKLMGGHCLGESK